MNVTKTRTVRVPRIKITKAERISNGVYSGQDAQGNRYRLIFMGGYGSVHIYAEADTSLNYNNRVGTCSLRILHTALGISI